MSANRHRIYHKQGKLSLPGYIYGMDVANVERESINFKLPKTLTDALPPFERSPTS
ncbi:MAG TPA: hypothetical protein IGS40_25810 [Trichormus sp. M33_DOE_039]|nr:hypothetical protein [Trichormus sp. M33_DOE_039]